MIYFTSDLHFGHANIIKMQNRPFPSVSEMNQVLLESYNTVVKKDDTAYILGDICHRMPIEEANEIISRMNGKKTLITGNHDKDYDKNLFQEICDFKTCSFDGMLFSLMHYPMLAWPKKRTGGIHLHGHLHSHEEYNIQNRNEGILRYDVGVDANYFYPVSTKQILDFFSDLMCIEKRD